MSHLRAVTPGPDHDHERGQRAWPNGTHGLVSSHILGEIERITEQIVLLHRGQVLALGNVHGIREQLDRIPHRIHIHWRTGRLAKSIIDMDHVHGVMIPRQGSSIPDPRPWRCSPTPSALLIEGGFKVTRIENPDDDLESVIGHLWGSAR